ncbi:MAG TPA: RNA polymerase factor sigma-54 [bacterium]|nr:RNA polymerase factor sigma-54 [bacterium]
MKIGFELRQGQSLAMTPQLQQSIRLLQLSTLELQAEIQSAVESNPMLELDESDNADNDPEYADDSSGNRNDTLDQALARATPDFDERSSNADERSSLETHTEQTLDLDAPRQDMPDELALDSRWNDIYEADGSTSFSRGDGENEDYDFIGSRSSGSDNLLDHLLSQLLMFPLSSRDQLIAAAIIESINDDGLLDDSLEEIVLGLGNDLPDIELDEALAMLHLVQTFDPPGVGARDLNESLQIQLRQLQPPEEQQEAHRHAAQLLKHLDLLGTHDYPRLRRLLNLSEIQLKAALSIIQNLDPHPGDRLRNQDVDYVVPDVFVRRVGNVWRAEMNSAILPKLRINQTYAGYIQRGQRSDDMSYMRNALQEARWFIKCVHSRHDTLFAVAEAIVRRQQAFFEHGETAMRPLVLREIAEELELHESTISRITSNKYMHTPKGVVEFRFFFSSHLATSDGNDASSTAIRAMLKRIIAAENPQKPLSDSRIADMLEAEGIHVARRTLAKYREALGIPPSSERKRPG